MRKVAVSGVLGAFPVHAMQFAPSFLQKRGENGLANLCFFTVGNFLIICVGGGRGGLNRVLGNRARCLTHLEEVECLFRRDKLESR